ncbi:MAG: hypothetical protein IJV12_04090, partial [Acidaminococcaceae bacterium]|nr:hypothetical protein [Acidaminococcaceae bacterium]
MDGEIAAEGRDDYEPDVADTVHDRSHDTAADFGADARLRQLIGNVAEAFRGPVLLGVSHDGAVTVDAFLYRSGHAA